MISINIKKHFKYYKDINERYISIKTINKTLKYINCRYTCDIDLLLVDNAIIKKINNDTRNINESTDVLSFPFINNVKKGKFIGDISLNPDNSLFLGQIVVNVDDYKLLNNNINIAIKEYQILLIHSVLHLFGYDHVKKEEEIEMFNLQNNILKFLLKKYD